MEIKTGLWNKQSKNGLTYASGKFTYEDSPFRVTLFINENKQNEKSPDYDIIIEKTDERPEEKPQAIQSISQDEIVISDDDLPF